MVGIIVILVILSQVLVVPYQNYISVPSHANIGLTFSKTILSSKSQLAGADFVYGEANDIGGSDLDEDALFEGEEEGILQGYEFSPEVGGQTGNFSEKESQLPSESISGRGLTSDKIAKVRDFNESEENPLQEGPETGFKFAENVKELNSNVTKSLALNASANLTKAALGNVVSFVSLIPSTSGLKSVDDASDTSVPHTAVNVSLDNDKKDLELQSSKEAGGLLQAASGSLKDGSGMVEKPLLKKSDRRPTSISDMTTLLHLGSLANYGVIRFAIYFNLNNGVELSIFYV